jgi:transposase-like protein
MASQKKISLEQKIQIVDELNKGTPMRELEAKYGLSNPSIYGWRKNLATLQRKLAAQGGKPKSNGNGHVNGNGHAAPALTAPAPAPTDTGALAVLESVMPQIRDHLRTSENFDLVYLACSSAYTRLKSAAGR